MRTDVLKYLKYGIIILPYLFLVWFFFYRIELIPIVPSNDLIIESFKSDLKDKIILYENQISNLETNITQSQKLIDSLKLISTKFKYIYIDKIKYIDTLTTIEQVEEFKKLFDSNDVE
mgnify:CR=1